MSSNTIKKSNVFIYELPYTERMEFCNIIDMNNEWKDLGGKYMKFDCATLSKIDKAPMRSHSFTDELLTLWGQQNHTILELFIILYKMRHYQAMTILKPFVDTKYHKLIYQGNQSFSNLVKSETTNLHGGVGNLIQFNTNSNEIRNNKFKCDDSNKSSTINEKTYPDPSIISSVEACLPLITYNELEKATNYWNKENILGKGGFGIVFKGMWKNTLVAIKRLEDQKGEAKQFNILEAQRQQSEKELKYLNSCRHDNILSLYGFSIGGEKPCLVYQYMVNGSLEDRLQCRGGTEPLTWNIRFKIAVGSARGLQFLHGMDKPLIHGDIKSANILLDPYFEPRIGDFGLAREGPLQEYTHVKVSRVHGTRPYLPDEFLRGKKFSTKVDTYSFGVVLFEIVTGQRAYDSLRNHKFLKDYVENYEGPICEIADIKAGSDDNNIFHCLLSIGRTCVIDKPKNRPEMEQVLRQLDCVLLLDRHQSTVRDSLMPTFQQECNKVQMRKMSTPSGSYHPQPWLFISPDHSNQQLPVPHTILDQNERLMPPIGENNTTQSESNLASKKFSDLSLVNNEISPDRLSLNNYNSNLDSKSNFMNHEANIKTKHSDSKNSVSEKLPLISALQIKTNEN
ncbi:Protein kinase, ATP binding site,Protein kinase domain,Serine/threonine-protein kinase, active site,Death [Cinara cedri]|uniref:non-specific serine/threonine protein kinase n=1 Tax=Cinara cedri TaxID=506608 RepID=A0A5E4M6Q5_9HEMI|nr:Protein kinase, ATP binding site,Protein kinase domain,Serine/threonine-protein kinase, active site,Death [Cinara cedri]